MSDSIKAPKSLQSNNTMKREEGPLEFLSSISKLQETPIHYLPGYKLLPGYVEPIIENEPELEPEPVYTLEEERKKLDEEPHTFIRSKIKEQVSDVVWLDKLRQNLVEMEEKKKAFADDRCIVCTLPYGTCEHTREAWLEKKHPEFKIEQNKDEVDQELDDVMAVIGGSMEVETNAESTTDIDIETMKWERMEAELSDKIGEGKYSLATPSVRGWHSTVYMDKANVIVLFGGLRYKKHATPQPFGPIPSKEDVEYLCDLYIYALIDRSWHGVKFHPDGPGGRYGHVAAALDDRRMMISGGRGNNGQFLSDTWIYDIVDDKWLPVDMAVDSPSPSPRVFSSSASVGADVYLFGGTDGTENFGDLWCFHGGDLRSRTDTTSALAMRWERVLAVGVPPSPRYGHKLVVLHEPHRTEFEERPRQPRMIVVGGCTVSPQSEVEGSNLTPAEHKRMLDLGAQLELKYRKEGDVAQLGGMSLMSSLANTHIHPSDPKDLYYQASRVTAHLAELEHDTRAAERAIVEAHNLSEASRLLKAQKARHPNSKADIYFLDLIDMTWRTQVYPPVSGEIPPCRMHFGAFSTCDYLLLVGGSRPTSLGHVCVDDDHSRIYALDLRRNLWFQAAPRSSSEYLELPISIAQADVTRAKNKVQVERDRGKSLGAKNGMTMELAEAEAVQKVCEWRLGQLSFISKNMVEPPAPRWGSSLEVCRSRGFLIGGWLDDRAVPNTDSYILDLEQEHERRRREDDEFHNRLEQQRRNEEARSANADMQSAYELKQMIAAEAENALKERHLMGIEDILACVPPLTRMKQPECVKVNASTVWLRWAELTQNSRELPVEPGSVIYRVYMISGYQHLALEDRVLVMPAAAQESIEAEMLLKARGDDEDMSIITASTALSATAHDDNNPLKAKLASTVSLGSSTAGPSAVSTNNKGHDFSNYRGPGFPGEIIRVHTNTGLFDIAFDDGQVEINVHRRRIRLEKERWEMEDDDDFDVLRQEDPPEGMSMAAWNAMRAEKAKIKEQNAHLTMLNKHAYMIREDMSIAAKRRITRKLGIRQRKLEALRRFTTPLEVLKQQEIEKMQGSKKKNKKKKDKSESEDGDEGEGKSGTGPDAERKGQDGDESSDYSSSDEGGSEQSFDLDPEKGFDRHAYMRKLDAPPKDRQKAHRVTVEVEKPWELVYTGNKTECEIGGIVPHKVLGNHPDYFVKCQFAIQAIGVDFPQYEHSELSDHLEVITRPASLATASSGAMVPQGGEVSPLGTPRAEESKTKKTLMDAINQSKRVKTGEEAWVLEGEGQGEYYM